MIQLDDICLAFGQQVIFDHDSCSIAPDQKVGLVGRNGSGKTTLLKVIAGQQSLDSGQIRMPKSFECAYMPQDVVLISQKTILHEALEAFPQMSRMLEEFVQLEHQISSNNADHDVFERYAALHHQLYEMGYESKRAQAEQILAGLGFALKQLEQPVAVLSVGWKMRLVLAKLLLQDADFYLFDEPTNHLDLIAKDWFVEFLRTASFGFMLVSHDEYFLNTICSRICEISMGNLTMYQGNYKKYLVQKEAHSALLEKKYADQQKFIEKQKVTIERFRAKASKARMVKSMIKSLEKIEPIELEHKQKTVGFSLPSVQRAGKVVLDVHDLSFSFGSKKIFGHAGFKILRGQKMAIVAPNGTGKSTLLNVLMGKYAQSTRTVSLGHNVSPVYFEQDQNQSLDEKNTIMQEVEAACETAETRARARNLLGAFLFSGDDVYKKIAVLSGGEKNRVAMVKILLQNANFLILDEPTNHLDIVSKNILLDVLSKFTGTILFVSHDRTFLNSLATNILELTSTSTFSYAGNYDAYLYQKKHRTLARQVVENSDKVHSAQVSKTMHASSSKMLWALKKEIQKCETAIKRLEKKVAKITEQFAVLAYGTPDYEQAMSMFRTYEQELKNKCIQWEEFMTKLDNISKEE